jgi:predicted dehydrogenase
LRDPALLSAEGRRATSLPGGHAEGFADTFKALYAAVYGAVAEGRPGSGYPTFADGHDEMLVCEAVARSAREERWVEVERSRAGARSGS